MNHVLPALLAIFMLWGSWPYPSPLCLASESFSDSDLPHWIWATTPEIPVDGDDQLDPVFVFQRTFEIADPIRTAKLRIAVDFCRATIHMNGVRQCSIEPYSETIEIDVTNAVLIGTNTLEIEAVSISGPVAVAASLSLGISNQPTLRSIITDATWTFRSLRQESDSAIAQGQAISHGEIASALWGIGRRSSKVEPSENYEQWRKAVAGSSLNQESFWTVPGFEIRRLHTATPEEGSWVSMAFDPKGRLTIAREEKGLLRLTLEGASPSIERVELIDDTLLECRGLLYAHGALYANANDSKGLYRLRDSDGDDVFDEIQLLRSFPGGVGHGRNDLGLGKDGWIYSIHGDSVDVPNSEILDHTSPYRDKRRSEVKGQGHVVRTDPEGKQWEIVCTGLRNPFGLSMNAEGDWFTYDADAEFDMGTPWYRPTRVVPLYSGADFGWRAVTGKWPPYFPNHADNAMPTLDIGRGSPTAVLFATHARFPDEYRRALLILDWTYGRVLAVHLHPRGGGYRANAETFLQGRPLNVTDLAVGPDGGLYIITGGRKTESSLYRIAYVGKQPAVIVPSPHEQACIHHASECRQIRWKLESMHSANCRFDLEFVWMHLDSPDWNIRHAARTALEHQPVEAWRDRARSERRKQASIEACLALLRSGDTSMISTVVNQLLQQNPDSLDMSQVMGLLQCYTLLDQSADDTWLARKAEIVEQLRSIFPHGLASQLTYNRCGTNVDVQGACAVLLASLGADSIVSAVFGSLLSSPVQEQRLLGLLALRKVNQGWNDEQRRDYFRQLNEGASFVRGEGMEKFLKQIRDEAASTLSDSQREELADLLDPNATPSDDIEPFLVRPTVQQWTLRDFDAALSDTSYRPDAARGKSLFGEVQCNRCHRRGARGPAVGPDLTFVASRFSRKDILQSIIEPSQVVAENYRSVQILTKDDRAIIGRLLIEGDYRSQKISIATDPLNPAQVIEIDKSDIESMKDSPLSPMPAGLVDCLNIHEVLDLLEFLRTPPE